MYATKDVFNKWPNFLLEGVMDQNKKESEIFIIAAPFRTMWFLSDALDVLGEDAAEQEHAQGLQKNL